MTLAGAIVSAVTLVVVGCAAGRVLLHLDSPPADRPWNSRRQ